MIDPKELRIGNWVDGGNNGPLYYQIKASDFVNTDFNRTKPIPLTPEILKACGVKQSSWGIGYVINKSERESKHLRWITNNFLSEEKLDQPFARFDSWFDIYYLHQLQNFYYLWAGKELQYKPVTEKA